MPKAAVAVIRMIRAATTKTMKEMILQILLRSGCLPFDVVAPVVMAAAAAAVEVVVVAAVAAVVAAVEVVAAVDVAVAVAAVAVDVAIKACVAAPAISAFSEPRPFCVLHDKSPGYTASTLGQSPRRSLVPPPPLPPQDHPPSHLRLNPPGHPPGLQMEYGYGGGWYSDPSRHPDRHPRLHHSRHSCSRYNRYSRNRCSRMDDVRVPSSLFLLLLQLLQHPGPCEDALPEVEG